ncbi:MAG TPA: energy-coupling factor transporter ATPase [Lachnospiraceae bacterium]|nr:energy-coupling factor transporter ATPase [Lachnospiraceae bacterium]
MALRVDDISYEYEKGTAMSVHALAHVSVNIPDGQFIGLVGHTGSGKSTFVQMLNGLLKPSEGHIYWNDQDIHADGFDRKKLRADVGLVFQYPEHQLFEQDVISDVMFGPRNLGFSEEECRKRAEKALRSSGLSEEFWKQSPFDLSGGQQRRAAIAGVLAMQPKVLILDEPTAGLDPRGRDEILDMVRGMKQQLHMTILLVSHSMDDVAEYADRIIVMNDAKILMDGSPKEVFARYKELEAVGLSAPQMVYIMQYLRECGLPVRTDILTVDEAAEEILRHRGELHVQ